MSRALAAATIAVAGILALAAPLPVHATHADAQPHRVYLPIAYTPPPPSTVRILRVPRDHPTIAAALAAARAGDVVFVAEGAYHEWGLTVPGGVTLRGAGWRRTMIWRLSEPNGSGAGSRASRPPASRRSPSAPLELAAPSSPAAPEGIGPVGVTLGVGAAVEALTIGADMPTATGVAVLGAGGAHAVRDVKFDQLYFGIWGTCSPTPDCRTELAVTRSLFLNCETAISADETTRLAADHLTIRSVEVGVRIRRPLSRMTNTIFEGVAVGVDNGPIDVGPGGIDAHHNLFSDTARPYSTWIPAVDGDLVVDVLLAPMDWWPTPLSPARHAASDGSDIGAIPFAGIGAPPQGLRMMRGAAPSPGAAAPWIVSWDPVPSAWLYHIVASPVDGGPPLLNYSYAEATGHDDGPMKVMDWLDPGRAYWVAVSTAYFERGESEASEAVLLPAEAGD